MNEPTNPFHPGVTAPPDRFVGRRLVMRTIEDELLLKTYPMPVISVVGQRRIGKTSLLRKLDETLGSREDMRFLFLDCLALRGASPAKFLNELVTRLDPSGRPTQDPEDPEDPWEQLAKALETGEGRVVFLLDELDALAGSSGPRYDGEFFSNFRSFLAGHADRLTIIAATARPLDSSAWAEGNDVGSPFYNLPAKTEIIGFLEEDAAWTLLGAGSNFLNMDERSFLLELAGLHPHFLHIAGSAAWTAKHRVGDDFRQQVREIFQRDARLTYREVTKNVPEKLFDELVVRVLFGTRGNVQTTGDLRAALLCGPDGRVYSQGLASYLVSDRSKVAETLTRILGGLYQRFREDLLKAAREEATLDESAKLYLYSKGLLKDDMQLSEQAKAWIMTTDLE